MISNEWIRSIALVFVALSLGGCGPAGRQIAIPNQLTTFPVTGEVSIDGEPGAFVTVKLNSQTPLNTGGYESAGMTDANGKFKISTYGKYDGAPAAEYALTFTRRPQTAFRGRPVKDELGERYDTVDKSPKKVVVEKVPLNIGKIELTTK